MTKDESVSEYNERVLEITNDSLLLGEKISESKIVRKMLGSLHRKFDMKITAIEEDQDITTLKLDELFGALLTFEMTMSNREINQDESIALLTKQFSKMARKLKSMNNAGTSVKTGRHDGENSTRKVNDFSYRRNSDHACITEINSEVDSGYSENEEDEELTLEKLKILRKEDLEARAIKKERIRLNGKKNKRLMGVISSLKVKLKEAHNEQNGSSKYGLGFDASIRSDKITPENAHISLVIPKDARISLVTPKDTPISLVIPKDARISLVIPKDTPIRKVHHPIDEANRYPSVHAKPSTTVKLRQHSYYNFAIDFASQIV
ncbi:gag-pol polyprotein [Cucumis melo var. makuwa]|uniref:Gag-pol polyprotein n=1 Tax=Cucumis melo var. makuwa TaxID=1194695 RepID=A0A5D3DDE9_CUCMM|nr:gag-pol polyprotein [Cucumis melo var. makuwa]